MRARKVDAAEEVGSQSRKPSQEVSASNHIVRTCRRKLAATLGGGALSTFANMAERDWTWVSQRHFYSGLRTWIPRQVCFGLRRF